MADRQLKTAREIGDALRARRVQLGLTQHELAALSHVSRQWLVKVESGHNNAELGKILAVARALRLAISLPEESPSTGAGIDLDDLLGHT